MQRRHLLASAFAASFGDAWAAPAPVTVAAAWRGLATGDEQRLGVLALDWAAGRVEVRGSCPLPGRAHGLLAEPGGTLLAVAMRPGGWLLRCDAQGQPMQRLSMDDERDPQRLDGHALASADGQRLYTPQTDAQGRGWLAVRDRHSLRTLDRWPTQGVDPHQLVLDADGHVLLANGGIARTPDGRQRDLDRMASSLVRLDARNGRLLGRWTLDDPRLSLRHLAWSRPADGTAPLLGVALQAEHDDPGQRARAPLLATWNGQQLNLVDQAVEAVGYAGDIAPVGPGGFAVSAQRADQGHLWWPGLRSGLQTFAAIRQPCALAAPDQGPDAGAVLLAGAMGVARWHPLQPPRMLPWPQPMALDNHWVVMNA